MSRPRDDRPHIERARRILRGGVAPLPPWLLRKKLRRVIADLAYLQAATPDKFAWANMRLEEAKQKASEAYKIVKTT